MIQILSSIFLLFIATPKARAFVDTKNANFTKTFVDLFLPSSNLPLSLTRSYSSRSLYKGMFGYGWCSNLETKVEVLPDNSINVVECGGGKEVPYYSAKKGNKTVLVDKIMSEVRKRKHLSSQYIRQVEKDVKGSSLLQSELIRAFGLEGKAKVGKTYRAAGNSNETLKFQGNRYVRRLANGEVQIFNKRGQLIQEMNTSGSWIKIIRKKGKIVRVMDNKGRALQFSYNKSGSLYLVKGPNKKQVEYEIIEDNLKRVVNTNKKEYLYDYDEYHNLTKIKYPPDAEFSKGSTESLDYNIKEDWVVSFKDKRDCKESYDYQSNKKTKDHYWTTVRKICGNTVTNNSRYEFWNKTNPAGEKYLYRARQNINGRMTDIVYDYATGGPLRVRRGSVTTHYAYHPDGSVRERKEPGRIVAYPLYDKVCKKPSRVTVKYVQGKKVVRQIHTSLSYDHERKKCHLLRADQKETGRWVEVKRDFQGRISEMWDQSKKRIRVTYNEAAGKPHEIIRPGVGAIRFFYTADGDVDNSKTQSDPAIATQITSVFNGFLELISPVASTNVTI